MSGSSYLKFPTELRSLKKGLINIKINDQKSFLCCHVRHINPVKINLERITQKDKGLVNDLDLCEKKIEKKNNICINVFGYENKLPFPIYISDQKCENSMDLLPVINENNSHYVYVKDFNRFLFHKTKNKNKKYFCKSCLQCFSSKNILTEHNGAKSVRLENGIIEFKNYFKQIPVPFKFLADFECNLEGVENYEGSCSKNIKVTFLVVLLTNLLVLIIDLLNQLFFLQTLKCCF